MDFHSYLTGLVDGEGSFLISFSLRQKRKFGIEPRPSFCISLHQRDVHVLEQVRTFLGCGGIRYNSSDGCYKYETRSLDEIVTKIIPHFQKYPLQTSKQKSFQLFQEICRMMRSNLHLNREGLIAILELAYQMNNLGARRYQKDFLLKVVNKMKV